MPWSEDKMNSIASGILTALMVLDPNLRGGQTGEVTGLWVPELPKSSRLRWFELRADGTVRAGFGAVLEATYRLAGTSLSLTPKGTPRGLTPMQMRIERDTAVREQRPRQVRRTTRCCPINARWWIGCRSH